MSRTWKIFKVLFSPIIFLFKTIFSLLFVVLLLVGLMYKSEKAPSFKEYNETIEVTIMNQLENEFTKLIGGEKESLNLGISEDHVNFIIDLNIDHIKSESAADEIAYVFGDIGKISVGDVWVEFNKTSVDIKLNGVITIYGINYKTQITARFGVINRDFGTVNLKLRQIRIGHVPYRWGLIIATELINLEQIINDALGDIATFDKETLELRFSLFSFVDETLLGFLETLGPLIDNTAILELGIINEKERLLGASLNFSRMIVDEVTPSLAQEERFRSSAEMNSYIQTKIDVNTFLDKEDFFFTELDLQKIFTYQLVGGNVGNMKVGSTPIFEEYEFALLNPAIILEENLSLRFPITIGTDEEHVLSELRIDFRPLLRDDNLVLKLSSARLGAIHLDKNVLKPVLDNFSGGVVNLNYEGELAITNFFGIFAGTEYMPSGVKIINKELHFTFKF